MLWLPETGGLFSISACLWKIFAHIMSLPPSPLPCALHTQYIRIPSFHLSGEKTVRVCVCVCVCVHVCMRACVMPPPVFVGGVAATYMACTTRIYYT